MNFKRWFSSFCDLYTMGRNNGYNPIKAVGFAIGIRFWGWWNRKEILASYKEASALFDSVLGPYCKGDIELAEQRSLMSVINQILREEDPEGLIRMGAPEDEYEAEASSITKELCWLRQQGVSIKQGLVALIVAETFSDYFGSSSYPRWEKDDPEIQQIAKRIQKEIFSND